MGQWALGLQRLGHAVSFLDPSAAALDERNARWLDRTWRETELAGVGWARRQDTAPPRAECLVNVMGLIAPDVLDERWPQRSVFLDIDPGYPQMWHELGLSDKLGAHDTFATLGQNIGRAGCTIPDCGLKWIPTPPPVVLDAWPACHGGTRFTTVASWRNPYGTVTLEGVTYGSRVHEFRKFMALPRLVDAEFELALDIDSAEVDDLRALEANGWRLVQPGSIAETPAAYRSYIQHSRAEFCVAQNMYVATRSGWLSDRSVCYLASGKPVLAQDTGLSGLYPVGEGLLVFSTVEEAAAGVEEIERNYERHSQAARALAEEYFDASKVLSVLVDRLDLEAA